MLQLPASRTTTGFQALTVGIRASALRVHPRNADLSLPGSVELAEISGSDTFVHVGTPIGEPVVQLPGAHQFTLDAPVTPYLDPTQEYVFDARGDLLLAPGAHPGPRGWLTWHASNSTWPTPTAPTRSATGTARCCR